MATVPGHMAQGWLGWQQGLAKSTRESGVATGPVHMVPGSLECQQGLATWHQRGWDCNRAWPHSTRVVGMATGPCNVAEGGWDGYRVWPHGTREAGMANRAWPHGTVEAGMLTVLLVWLKCPATWHNDGLDGNRVWLTAPGSLGWQQGLATCLQGG